MNPFCDIIHQLEADNATIADLAVAKKQLTQHVKDYQAGNNDLSDLERDSPVRLELQLNGESIWNDRKQYASHPAHTLAAFLHPLHRSKFSWDELDHEER